MIKDLGLTGCCSLKAKNLDGSPVSKWSDRNDHSLCLEFVPTVGLRCGISAQWSHCAHASHVLVAR